MGRYSVYERRACAFIAAGAVCSHCSARTWDRTCIAGHILTRKGEEKPGVRVAVCTDLEPYTPSPDRFIRLNERRVRAEYGIVTVRTVRGKNREKLVKFAGMPSWHEEEGGHHDIKA